MTPKRMKREGVLRLSDSGIRAAASGVAAPSDWQSALPTISTPICTLREIRLQDAPSLIAHLSTEEVSRFITPPPNTIEEYERFITWTHHNRAKGQSACWVVVPAGTDAAIGVFQFRSLEGGFATGEWGFAMGSHYWGSGLFVECARQLLDFAFDTVGVLRLEARAAVMNGRGNGALRKIGAVQEGVLRRSFPRKGQLYDQVLWSMLAEDWRMQRRPDHTVVH